jgi:hypothetical protein
LQHLGANTSGAALTVQSLKNQTGGRLHITGQGGRLSSSLVGRSLTLEIRALTRVGIIGAAITDHRLTDRLHAERTGDG